jgi:exosortase
MSVAGASYSHAHVEERPFSGRWLWLAAVLVVAVAAYGPLLWMFFRQQWEKPHYQYFPFVIVAFGWLLWQRYREGTPRVPVDTRWPWIDWLLFSSSFALLLASILLVSPWGAAASLILLAGYACRLISRRRHVTYLWGVWAMLWLLVPLPFNLDQALTAKLQAISSRLSSFVLDALGVHHLMEGNVLTLPEKQLFVDEACSGIVSILSVVACAVIYGVVKNRSPLHLVLLALAGIGWATVINVARISIIAFLLDRMNIDWSAGAPHEILSLSLFLVTFLALLSTDRILMVCLEPIRERWHENHANDLSLGAWVAAAWDALTRFGRPHAADDEEEFAEVEVVGTHEPAARPRRLTPAFSWRPVLIFLPLALVQATLFGYALKTAPANIPAVQRAIALDANSMPSTLLGLERVDFKAEQRDPDNIHGMYSRTYTYRSPEGAQFVVSFDFPFVGGWHELTMCYTAGGWEPIERRITTKPGDQSERAWRCVEADFSRAGGDRGAVLFSEFDQYGTPFNPQEGWMRADEAFWKVRNYYLEDRRAFQVQVFIADTAAASEADRQKAKELLFVARDHFRNLVVNGLPMADSSEAKSKEL